MSANWKVLNVSRDKGPLPLLLAKHEFGLSQYSVSLTDLTYIWTESQERKQIVKRALVEDTSIDPSENTAQLQLLLQNVQKALNGGQDTRLSLSKGGTPKQLILQTTTSLPGTLKPLCWPIHLVPASQHLLTSELLLPCLSRQFLMDAQLTSLSQLLKEKDRLLTRLVDRMQADGTDLSKIFPGAAGLKRGIHFNPRAALGRCVKGLDEFNEEHWRKDFAASARRSFDVHDILSQVLATDQSNGLEIEHISDDWNWWEQIEHEEILQIDAPTERMTVRLSSPQIPIKSRDCQKEAKTDQVGNRNLGLTATKLAETK